MIDESLLQFHGRLDLVGIIVQNDSTGRMVIKLRIWRSRENGAFPMGRGLIKPVIAESGGHNVAGAQILLGPVVDGTCAFLTRTVD